MCQYFQLISVDDMVWVSKRGKNHSDVPKIAILGTAVEPWADRIFSRCENLKITPMTRQIHGQVGFEVAQAFWAKGYTVYGLSRSQVKADAMLLKNEMIPIIGQAKDTSKWIDVAMKVDVIVEAVADYTDWSTQSTVFEALKSVATARPDTTILFTSGLWLFGENASGDVLTEDSELAPNPLRQGVPVEHLYQSIGAIVVLATIVYGRAGGHTATFFHQIEQGSVKLYRSAEQVQTYCHTSDMAQIYVLATEKSKQVRGQMFIAGAYVEKVSDVVQSVADAVNANVTINYVEPSNPLEYCLAMSQRSTHDKATRLLGWTPKRPSLTQAASLYYNSWIQSNVGGDRYLYPGVKNYQA
eukprot:gene6242-7232_t